MPTMTLPISDGRRLTPRQKRQFEVLADRFHRRSLRSCTSRISASEASDTSLSSEATSKIPEADSTTLSKGTGKDSTGSGSSSGSGTSNQRSLGETSVKIPSNSWTTLKLFIASLVLGAGSLTAHFTDFLGEGPTKNLVSFGLDTGTTLGLALTASSALAPISNDASQHNLN